jgi:hypothetical protein
VARATVSVGGRPRTANFLEPRPRGRLYQAVVIGQLVDELTGEPVLAPIRVTSDLTGARPRSAADGVVGLAGVPVRLFPLLATQPYAVVVRVEASGYQPLVERVTFGPQPAFPAAFTCADLGALAATPSPVVISGQTSELGPMGEVVPLGGVDVQVTRLWRRSADLGGVPATASIISLDPGMYASRPVGATVKIVSLAATAEPPRTLVRDAAAGAASLAVSHTMGLAPGTVLGFDRGVPEREEHVEVGAVDAPSDASSPGVVTLRHPLQLRHRQGAPAARITVSAAGPPEATLTDPARRGDRTAFVSSVGSLGSADAVRISGGPAAAEYLTSRRYRTLSLADGTFRLPPLGRVAAVEIEASRLALSAGPLPFTPNYAVTENRLDLTLT